MGFFKTVLATMNNKMGANGVSGWGRFLGTALAIVGLVTAASVQAAATCDTSTVTLNVVDENNQPVNGFRWILEEDLTWVVEDGPDADAVDPNARHAGQLTNDAFAYNFHRSYVPIIDKGESATDSTSLCIPKDVRGFVSVLPGSGYQMNGGAVAKGVSNVTVYTHSLPVPTAQIVVRVFEDKAPINGVPDDPEESVYPGGEFKVKLEDGGGGYGIGGPQLLNAFGDLIGTEYVRVNPADPNSDFVYDADGTPRILTQGQGFVVPDPTTGLAVIKYLSSNKYGVIVVPPAGEGWVQTSTIEGTPVVDAWVLENEPSYFVEFGPPGYHVFIGFTKDFDCFTPGSANHDYMCRSALDNTPYNIVPGTGEITGQIVNNHMSMWPTSTFYNGHNFEGCRVGLNEGALGKGRALWSQPCDGNSSFTIKNVPAGQYSVVVWDDNLTVVIAKTPVTVDTGVDGGFVDLGEVAVFDWFGRLFNTVFYDRDGNGFRDCPSGSPECDDPLLDDIGLAADKSVVNLRFRNGVIQQSMAIDMGGEAPMEEVFPYFHWQVAEVDFGTMKATGVTAVVDAGGPVNAHDAWYNPTFDSLTPAPQFCTQDDVVGLSAAVGICNTVGTTRINPYLPGSNNNLATTYQGPVLTLGLQSFLGQTEILQWGKQPYVGNENGGISGIVFDALTRAENDPMYAAAEPWEAGIPNIQMALYKSNIDGMIIDNNGNGTTDTVDDYADVDNYPFGWSDGSDVMGKEDIDYNGNGAFDLGDAIQITTTDSWDDSIPTGCQAVEPYRTHLDVNGNPTALTKTLDCYDGVRVWNQLTEGVFDGGYAFGLGGSTPDLNPGYYIVESGEQRSRISGEATFTLLKEEDKNVDFGDEYKPGKLLALPPRCVGGDHVVPAVLSYQTMEDGVTIWPGEEANAIASPYAGQARPLCDRKLVKLTAGRNAAADFHYFSEVPKAAHAVGMILNDLANEFDPNNPNFGEKFGPSWVPVTFRDWTGRVVSRIYADEFGRYNALVPASSTVNVGSPTGLGPKMLQACMNDASPVPDGNGGFITDPFHNDQFSQFCYPMSFRSGSPSYLDTPVLPIAAFAPGNSQAFPLVCEADDGIPTVYSVNGPQGGAYAEPGQQLTITSLGTAVEIPNPAYDGTPATDKIITRNYGFGSQGQVMIGNTVLDISSWNVDTIVATIPVGTTAGHGQLQVVNGSGIAGEYGVTVTVGPYANGSILHVPADYPTIQAAIEAANQTGPGNQHPRDLILVSPGQYDELVVMYKPVVLQGSGAAATTINAIHSPVSKVQAWRDYVYNTLAGEWDLVPAQASLAAEEGPGIVVLAKNANFNQGGFGRPGGNSPFAQITPDTRIDGFKITGTDIGGAILLNGYAHYMEISNNILTGNSGTFGGGIRLGHPTLLLENGGQVVDSQNDHVNIHHNRIVKNGGMGGAGGAISIHSGSNRYVIDHNYICGNFTTGNGGGIGHLGLSNRGVISNNTVIFNASFNQGTNVTGGGIYIGGNVGAAGSLSTGSGTVTINANRIQGNYAGAGDGGGIMLEGTNGVDLTTGPNGGANVGSNWYRVNVTNNYIVNNVSGVAGGGITMLDALKVNIQYNTIADNDSTGTGGAAFTNGVNTSVRQEGAGVSSRVNSAAVNAALPNNAPARYTHGFSYPVLRNNIIWENRNFYWSTDIDPTTISTPEFGLSNPLISDLAVHGLAGAILNPRRNILTDVNGYHTSNCSADPGFVAPYFNGARQTIQQQEQQFVAGINTAAAFDEGGNFIDVSYGPLQMVGDYHLMGAFADLGCTAINNAAPNTAGVIPSVNLLAVTTNENTDAPLDITTDFDGDPRGIGGGADIGADEFTGTPYLDPAAAPAGVHGNNPDNAYELPVSTPPAGSGSSGNGGGSTGGGSGSTGGAGTVGGGSTGTGSGGGSTGGGAVTPPPALQTVADGPYGVVQGMSVNMDVLSNDCNGTCDNEEIVTPPAYGTLTHEANGTLTYLHDGDPAHTSDTFTYSATKGTKVSPDSVTVVINVTMASDPTAVDDSYTIGTGTGATGRLGDFVVSAPGVLTNDGQMMNGTVNVDPSSLTAQLVSDVMNNDGKRLGRMVLNSDGSFMFNASNLTYTGPMTFTYQVSDAVNTSAPATVTLQRDITVKKNIFRSKPGNAARGKPARHRWKLSGFSSAPTGSTVKVYLGDMAGGKLVGETTVDHDNEWKLRKSMADGSAIPFQTDGTVISTISVVVEHADDGSVDELINVPLDIRGVMPN